MHDNLRLVTSVLYRLGRLLPPLLVLRELLDDEVVLDLLLLFGELLVLEGVVLGGVVAAGDGGGLVLIHLVNLLAGLPAVLLGVVLGVWEELARLALLLLSTVVCALRGNAPATRGCDLLRVLRRGGPRRVLLLDPVENEVVLVQLSLLIDEVVAQKLEHVGSLVGVPLEAAVQETLELR